MKLSESSYIPPVISYSSAKFSNSGSLKYAITSLCSIQPDNFQYILDYFWRYSDRAVKRSCLVDIQVGRFQKTHNRGRRLRKIKKPIRIGGAPVSYKRLKRLRRNRFEFKHFI